MNIFLIADADASYDASGYSYSVANFPVKTERKYGWTVVEAYFNGLLSLSNFLIKDEIYKSVTGFVMCTPSKQVINILTTDYLEQLEANSWKSLNSRPLFHVPLLKELYYHRIFYKERNILWTVQTEIGDSEYHQFERCKDYLSSLLTGKDGI